MTFVWGFISLHQTLSFEHLLFYLSARFGVISWYAGGFLIKPLLSYLCFVSVKSFLPYLFPFLLVSWVSFNEVLLALSILQLLMLSYLFPLTFAFSFRLYTDLLCPDVA